MAILYTKQPANRSFAALGGITDPKRLARDLVPTGNGWADVVNDFPWTLTPERSASRRETPFIQLKEYYMQQNALNQQLLPYGIDTSSITSSGGVADLMAITRQTINSDTEFLYEGLFDLIAPTGFYFRFPLFTQEQYSTNNSWERKDILDTVINFQKMGLGYFGGALGMANRMGRMMPAGMKYMKSFQNLTKGGEAIMNAAQAVPDIIKQVTMLKLQKQNPAAGLFDPPQLWQGSSPREYGFSFLLFNTESKNNSVQDVTNLILRNWELCYMLTYQNSFNKRNFFTGLVPVYYEVTIPGVHYCKASVMKNINITNVGNIRVVKLPIDDGPLTDVNVPDAYKIDIVMQDVLMPSKNLHESVINARYQQSITEKK
jgi:hypothetical protein